MNIPRACSVQTVAKIRIVNSSLIISPYQKSVGILVLSVCQPTSRFGFREIPRGVPKILYSAKFRLVQYSKVWRDCTRGVQKNLAKF